MVSGANLLEKSNSPTSDNYEDNCECDDVSVSSSQDESDGAIVLSHAEANKSPCFQNIEVSNSNDVHFGNKTYYQGPVTIKQILYANPNADISDGLENVPIKEKCIIDKTQCIGKDNSEFVTDAVPQANGFIKSNNDKINLPPGVNKGTKWLKNFSKKRCILTCSMATVLVVALATLAAILLTRHMTDFPRPPPIDSPEQEVDAPLEDPEDPNVNVTLSGKLKIIYRRMWLAQPPTEAAHPLTLPVPYVIIMHTASETCKTQSECVFSVRQIQSFHIDGNGWWDIGYNFLVGGDGFAYEGRGWKAEGAHTFGYNSRSIGIAFIGTFNSIEPEKKQIVAAKQLIEQGVEKGYIAKNYKLLAARQVSSTKSPGQVLYEDVKKWPHWSATP